MTEDQMMELVKDIVGETDYDIYKELFVYEQEPEDEAHTRQRFLRVVQKHLGPPTPAEPKKRRRK